MTCAGFDKDLHYGLSVTSEEVRKIGYKGDNVLEKHSKSGRYRSFAEGTEVSVKFILVLHGHLDKFPRGKSLSTPVDTHKKLTEDALGSYNREAPLILLYKRYHQSFKLFLDEFLDDVKIKMHESRPRLHISNLEYPWCNEYWGKLWVSPGPVFTREDPAFP